MQKQHLNILFSRALTPFSAAIRAYPPNGPYSHCAALTEDERVIEALAFKGGVVETNLNKFIRRNTRVSLLSIEVEDAKIANDWLRSTLGSGYDWFYNIAIPFRLRGINDKGNYSCSEHIANYATKAGLDIFAPGMHGLTPNHLYQLLYASGGRVTKEYK
jgi:uncharacterized protein YycO